MCLLVSLPCFPILSQIAVLTTCCYRMLTWLVPVIVALSVDMDYNINIDIDWKGFAIIFFKYPQYHMLLCVLSLSLHHRSWQFFQISSSESHLFRKTIMPPVWSTVYSVCMLLNSIHSLTPVLITLKTTAINTYFHVCILMY